MKRNLFKIIATVVTVIVVAFGCKQEDKTPVEMLGAGATFPNPLYAKMFDEYYNLTSNKVNYQAIGSGGGIKQLLEKTVDFGATDAFMNDKAISEAGAEIVHVPTALGAVVLVYNIPGNPELKFTPEVIADIFMGKIKKWNDPKIAADNADAKLPDLAIKIAVRADGSGTTDIFTAYLDNVSKDWHDKVGRGKSVTWPTETVSGKGNPGVAGLVTQMPGAIGYVEVAYAKQNNIAYGQVKNKSGNFIKADLAAISAAAAGEVPADTRIDIVNTAAADGYPICSFTWLIVYKEQNYNARTAKQAKELVKLINWMVTDGQQFNESLDYGKLPAATVEKALTIIKSVTFDGKVILKK